MDSKTQFRIINSFLLSKIGIIVEFKDIEFGFPSGSLLKSRSSGLYWEIKNRIIETANDKKFEGESELHAHLNIRNIDTKIKGQNTEINSFLYSILPIGHLTKPQIDELLVFHKTIAISPLKIIEDYEGHVLLEGNAMMSKKYILRRRLIQVGDSVKHCQHGLHDLINDDGDFINRNVT